ncbi:uncharacterized protein LOC120359478 [Solenopsis invicta]|uniref:uncharacterized protein LOC120359478 n=1 Tax=Solenopsis invicta TaxID=13686 RepID=UPI00193DF6A4|nr:uncharacterized protein LOC120359478 [Solenopsis invicta]
MERGRDEGVSIAFWNVAGLRNKDKEFWKGMERWEVMVLIETWIEEKGWKYIEGKLPKGYEWKVQWAKRRNKKGRAIGGMMLGIRRELVEGGKDDRGEREGIIKGEFKYGRGRLRVVGVYANQDLGEKLEGLRGWMEEKEEGIRTICGGGDFNARTGEEGGKLNEDEWGEEEKGRKSMDKKVNKEGRKLIEFIRERGWWILNGGISGDEEGNWTYSGGRGESVIDVILINEGVEEEIESLKVGDQIDSDHHPVIIRLKKGEGKKKQKGRKYKVGHRGRWDEEGRERFRRELGRVEVKEEGVQKGIKDVGRRIRETLERMEEEGRMVESRGRGWWDEECREKKRKVRRTLREWRKGWREGQEYRKERREYKEICEKKKREENRRWEREAEEARSVGQVWRIVNRERKKWKGIDREIKMKDWEEYFKRLMGGTESRVMGGVGREERLEGESELNRGEIVLRKIKEGKAIGMDGVPGEAWKYGGEEIDEWIWKMCNKIWRGEGWPKDWNEGVLVPILKRGKGKIVGDYRGVTIMPTMYKIYTAALAERLREEVEGKELIPPNQTGFRKGMGTLDNIYILNYLVNRQIERKERKMMAVFVDLRAAVDSVDRGILLKAMRERGVREGLVERVAEVLRETRSRVRVSGEVGKGFWTARGVRQGCPLSPILFNLLVADLEEEMRKVKWGGVKIGEVRVYTLSYADDVVLLAEGEGEMKSMLERLERFMDRKGLEVNVEKTKVLRFREGGGRMSKAEWRWKGKRIEEVKEYKYLGYMFQRNGGQEAQIRDRVAKAAAVKGQVWGIGKRRFGRDWKRRVWLFDTLVWTVMGYGVEIWGWKEREGVERLHERYLRWVLGVEGRTGYLVREETQREKLRGRAGKRVWGFEERLEGGGGKLVSKDVFGRVEGKDEKEKGGIKVGEGKGQFF